MNYICGYCKKEIQKGKVVVTEKEGKQVLLHKEKCSPTYLLLHAIFDEPLHERATVKFSELEQVVKA